MRIFLMVLCMIECVANAEASPPNGIEIPQKLGKIEVKFYFKKGISELEYLPLRGTSGLNLPTFGVAGNQFTFPAAIGVDIFGTLIVGGFIANQQIDLVRRSFIFPPYFDGMEGLPMSPLTKKLSADKVLQPLISDLKDWVVGRSALDIFSVDDSRDTLDHGVVAKKLLAQLRSKRFRNAAPSGALLISGDAYFSMGYRVLWYTVKAELIEYPELTDNTKTLVSDDFKTIYRALYSSAVDIRDFHGVDLSILAGNSGNPAKNAEKQEEIITNTSYVIGKELWLQKDGVFLKEAVKKAADKAISLFQKNGLSPPSETEMSSVLFGYDETEASKQYQHLRDKAKKKYEKSQRKYVKFLEANQETSAQKALRFIKKYEADQQREREWLGSMSKTARCEEFLSREYSFSKVVDLISSEGNSVQAHSSDDYEGDYFQRIKTHFFYDLPKTRFFWFSSSDIPEGELEWDRRKICRSKRWSGGTEN